MVFKLNWRGSPKERFWRSVKKSKDCWLWTGKKAGNGYGQIYDSGYKYTHRFSYEIHKGKIGKGMCICHTCDNPPCVNPDHLWEGTRKQNSKDMSKKGRHGDLTGEKCGKSKLTWSQVAEIRNLYKPGEITMKQIAVKYGLGYTTIQAILRNKTWKI
jgi:HNH endonuclease